jgi:hypothetical protein
MNLARSTIAEGTDMIGYAEAEVVGAKTGTVARDLGVFSLKSGPCEFSAVPSDLTNTSRSVDVRVRLL